MEIKTFLKNLPAFEDFNPAQLDLLATHLKQEEWDSGHVFIRQGTQGEALYLLIDGSVIVTRKEEDSDEEHEVRELSDGEMFGMLSLIDDLPASATCTAKGAVRTAALPRDAFRQLYHQARPVGLHLQYMIAVQMARDLQEVNKRFRASLMKS